MADLPARPDLRHLRDEAKRRTRDGEFASLSAAQLAVARDHGFVSWPRLKLFVESRALDRGARAQAMVRSACSDDPRLAKVLLEAEPELSSYDLAAACVTGDLAAAERLLTDVDARIGPLGWTPLLYAGFSRLLRTEQAPAIIAVAELLLAAGADPNASRLHDDSVQVPLYGAAGIANNAELTRLLLEAGADPDETLTDSAAIGEALYHAVEFADSTCARLLLEAGTAAHKISYCLGRALDFDRAEMVRLLLAHGAQPTSAQLRKAIRNRRPLSLVRDLLDAGAPLSRRALRLAVRHGRDDVAALLVSRGLDLSFVSDEDRLPDADLLHDAVHLGDAALVGRLLGGGIAADAVTEDNPDPTLGSACWRGYLDVVQALVESGASLSWPQGSPIGAAMHGSQHCHDPQGGPMSLPVDEERHGDYPGVVRFLIADGATIPGDYGGSPEMAEAILADLGIGVGVPPPGRAPGTGLG